MDNHKEYLIGHYKTLARQLVSGQITLEQFAQLLTENQLKLEERADHDGLVTQFLNNKGFHKTLNQTVKTIHKLKLTGSLIALDLDNLKQFNDTLGHPSGDRLIEIYASIIAKSAEDEDIKGRLGGDEFALFLFNKDIIKAQRIAEKIRLSIQTEVQKVFKGKNIATVSAGVATLQSKESAQDLIERADQALYIAKEEKNKVVTF